MAKISLSVLAAMIAMSGAATAHPGSKLLTFGGGKERAATTSGVSFEEINGVHLFRGGRTLDGDGELVIDGQHNLKIEIVKKIHTRRSFRRMRTQGFYSGTGPKSRRFTQGFYSGR